jgi:intraflagellar transport protein 172
VQDLGQFSDAEAAFLRASKPREAIEMYVHQGLWTAALHVAEGHDAAAVSDIYCKQGDFLASEHKMHEAETTYLQAKAPDRVIKMFRDAQMWDDALRIARHYKPEVLHELERQREACILGGQSTGSTVDAKIQKAKLFERQVHAALSFLVLGTKFDDCLCSQSSGSGISSPNLETTGACIYCCSCLVPAGASAA